MIVIGLTGSIGMGKSTVAAMFAARGLPVFDADAAVHRLYEAGGAAAEALSRRFPDAVRNGQVDRQALSRVVVDDPAALAELEAIVHPLVRAEREAFLDTARKGGEAAVIFEIPLLFETGGDREVDRIVVVSAPPEIQAERVLARPGMTEEKLAAILARQVPDSEKRARADHVIDTSGPLENTRSQVDMVLRALDLPVVKGHDTGDA